MVSLKVFNKTGDEVGVVEIDERRLAPEVNRQLLHDAVVMYQANARQGTARTLTRAEVAGSTKKMYRQKGTGNARAGSRRSGIRRGGGHIHAIRPRDYSYRLPRKALLAATRMAIVSKLRDQEIVVIDELSFASPKTKEMAGILKALKLEGKSVLVATAGHDLNVYKSGRNIERVSVSPVTQLNALEILKPSRLLVTKAVAERWKSQAAERPAPEAK